ncbi:MAG: transcription termination factor NusA [Clostridia bacterium]
MIDKDFFTALDQLELEKGISKEAFIKTLEDALVFAYKKHFGSSARIDVKLNEEKAMIEVFATKVVVEEISDNENEIVLEEALKVKKGVKVGDLIVDKIVPKDFGRIAAQTAKQVVMQRLREFERESAMNELESKENEILTGIIRRTDGQSYYIDLGQGQVEGVLMAQDQIKTEKYRINDKIKVFVKKIRATPMGPQVVVSRSATGLVKKLFENEVPEIRQGIVTIKAIAREAGQRTKIAIASEDPNIDPVGACVGAKGVRVNAIVAELLGEKIDIIPWSEDPLEFIARSLSPAEVKYVESVEDEKKAKVVVADDKLSLAIGKEGQNARLAARLTGWKIDVKSQSSFEQENQEKLEGANEFYEEELAKLESEDAEKAANADNAVEQVENDIVDTDVENVDDALTGVDEVEMSNETEIKE